MKYTSSEITVATHQPLTVELGELQNGDCFYYGTDKEKKLQLMVEIHSEQARCICLNDGKVWVTQDLKQLVNPVHNKIYSTPIFEN